ncbi:MFS transporter [Erwinia phyllosphaerae]|uniref:MFS transporter n=1 Tax=Erwinia phyllosphaerae TaxID=2853256 RepID=UPI001FEE7A1F|nr:MFS transporter [Erwinia phyllosphaerae]MBV4365346.1 MFS transporter [Erwinia phyllosphaerae]
MFNANQSQSVRRGCLALLAFAQLIISLDINIVFVALPEIGKGLHFSGQSLQWVVSAYTVFCGGFLLLGGRAADQIGQKRMFIFALFLYAASSLMGAIAWTPEMIIVARAVQGTGGAFLFPATLSLLNRLFTEGSERNRALAIWGGAGASGLTLGSLSGGILTEYAGWASVFYINVLLAGIAIILAVALLPADKKRAVRQGFDMPGALTVTAASTLLVFSLVQGPEEGWRSVTVPFTLSVLSLILFVVIELKSRTPLMPLTLLKNRYLLSGVVITFIYMGTFGALPYFETILFQDVLKYSALKTGLAFIVPSVFIFAGTQAGARLTGSFGTRSAMMAGCLTGIAGTLMMMYGATVTGTYLMLLPGLIVSGIGQGIVWTTMWISAATGVRHDEQGIASGMASTTLNVGNAIGLAILIAVATSLSRHSGEVHDAFFLATMAKYAFMLAATGMFMAFLIACFLPSNTPSALDNKTLTPAD